ncbi:MAG TPA: efflux RND transporter periplasmic adaptor subunit [Vicinamibacterales bacterium]|nr:efflux RND transporter periplasmic adaptor subunit [Vicinamibacterales bacterium]
MFRRKWFWVLVALIIIGGGAGTYFARKRDEGVAVASENIYKRDLEAIVSASGKIDPKKTVNISAQSMGRVTRLAVKEGDRVKAGQFLLQIDPILAQSAVRRDEAAVNAAATGLEQARVSLQSAQASLDLARQNFKRQQDLWESGLTTRESLERAQAEVDVRESDLRAREQEIKTRQEQVRVQQAGLTSSQHSLSQARFDAPFDGIVTRRNVEEGENVVVGTMNNAGTVLLTIADMSVIEAEVEVDETDIPLVKIGQPAKVTVDAIEGKTLAGHVSEIGNSPIQTAGAATGGARTATNFKVVVTLEGEVPEVRPGFTCTAEISTEKRSQAVAVPIQALTVRELLYDEKGNLIREPRPPKPSRFRFGPSVTPPVSASTSTELKPGQKREETEGVFVIRDNKAAFVPVKVGIAGERYFEVVSGLKEGDRVITGPFESVRNLYDGDLVKVNTAPAAR